MNDRVRYQLRQATADVGWLEDVLKNAVKIGPGDCVRKYRHRSVAEIQRTNVVQPENMIDMTVRYQHRIDLSDIRPQCLLAKIYRCIDKNCFPGVLD